MCSSSCSPNTISLSQSHHLSQGWIVCLFVYVPHPDCEFCLTLCTSHYNWVRKIILNSEEDFDFKTRVGWNGVEDSMEIDTSKHGEEWWQQNLTCLLKCSEQVCVGGRAIPGERATEAENVTQARAESGLDQWGGSGHGEKQTSLKQLWSRINRIGACEEKKGHKMRWAVIWAMEVLVVSSPMMENP